SPLLTLLGQVTLNTKRANSTEFNSSPKLYLCRVSAFNCRIFAYAMTIICRRYQMTIQDRIQTRVKRSKRSVFLRSDFTDIADYDQVGRGLRSLVQEGLLLKIG
ncbi:hypothetical protein ORI99_10085, partial [Alishewanella sp. SMS9]|nr:hypothetical protein [Alishewanella sp. SMS9]